MDFCEPEGKGDHKYSENAKGLIYFHTPFINFLMKSFALKT